MKAAAKNLQIFKCKRETDIPEFRAQHFQRVFGKQKTYTQIIH